MTGISQSELIVLLIFGAGVCCSLFLLFWLVRLIRRDNDKSRRP